ncbi:MAG: hypothetical protein PHU62_07445 [Bacteroidales bacterium]|jgi:hypothetical protein|nr:hypothetical protein [Bacteroidales bacterium]MDD2205036.1 hypothetical protein [Bacteroidales bacterium]MDD3151506.1 hypothetical protein [Bacteroidales bacterium]MDD3914513.1 hypothetical protein [Bacteroidales bacterium]MDD4634387.1 hypothetical protein [Bacteroidales bacterium]
MNRNPFLINGYVSPEVFCDREKELTELFSRIICVTFPSFSMPRCRQTVILKTWLEQRK